MSVKVTVGDLSRLEIEQILSGLDALVRRDGIAAVGVGPLVDRFQSLRKIALAAERQAQSDAADPARPLHAPVSDETDGVTT